MAIGTARRDSCVVIDAVQDDPSRPNRVTTVAGQIRLDMCCRFPGRLDSIVTGGAGAGNHSGMGEGDRRPHRRTMAGVALHRRKNMGRRFSPLD